MDFSYLLGNDADVYTKTEANTGGRVSVTWTKQCTIPCRFSSPSSTRVNPVAGTSLEKIDAIIFTGPELLTVTHDHDLPVRFTTVSPGWYGTYELRTRPRVICGADTSVHHCECDVTEVQNP